ncbi:hypothetical protein B0U03_02270 [Listeria monocytogenes]|nr:hypothetical protein [Listeria monocytogenes]EAE9692167.1 hypothetical protein [Listeria monocytogenes]EAE9709652.1 hypothetical protein [Listeria monocytogenes]
MKDDTVHYTTGKSDSTGDIVERIISEDEVLFVSIIFESGRRVSYGGIPIKIESWFEKEKSE